MPERIALLAREVIERIAAGEVIERPASVVRELIDNALDAGATTIRIEMQHGGLRLIRVADDGEGVPADDVLLTVTPHATSKVRSVADLERVVTLGFRGEALASIAAVAELEIASAADESGLAHALRVGLDAPAIVTETPRTRGTTVIVRDLFATVPARRALLRSARVEAGRILAVVRAYALAHPATRFTVVGDGSCCSRRAEATAPRSSRPSMAVMLRARCSHSAHCGLATPQSLGWSPRAPFTPPRVTRCRSSSMGAQSRIARCSPLSKRAIVHCCVKAAIRC